MGDLNEATIKQTEDFAQSRLTGFAACNRSVTWAPGPARRAHENCGSFLLLLLLLLIRTRQGDDDGVGWTRSGSPIVAPEGRAQAAQHSRCLVFLVGSCHSCHGVARQGRPADPTACTVNRTNVPSEKFIHDGSRGEEREAHAHAREDVVCHCVCGLGEMKGFRIAQLLIYCPHIAVMSA